MLNQGQPEIYAIDFGTTNSLLAAANRQHLYRALPLDPGASDPTVFRSVLHFDVDGECRFGAAALEHYRTMGLAGRLVRSLKRHLASRHFVSTEVSGRSYRLEELIAGILRVLRERANRHFDCDVTRVVLGRPARFAESAEDETFAEQRLLAAAKLAGFSQVTLCAEPLAAAHDFRGALQESRLVLIADLGGGTSDFSLIRMSASGYRPSDVLSTGGVGVAGDALDGALMKHHIARYFGAAARYRAPFGSNELRMPLSLVHRLYSPVDLSLLSKRELLDFLRRIRSFSVSEADREAVGRLVVVAEDALGFDVYEAIEAVKQALAGPDAADVASFELDYPEVEVVEAISRGAFATAVRAPLDAVFACLEDTLERAGVEPREVEVVCCTGGTSRVALVAERLHQLFPTAAVHRLSSFRAVVDGLAREAQQQLLAS